MKKPLVWLALLSVNVAFSDNFQKIDTVMSIDNLTIINNSNDSIDSLFYNNKKIKTPESFYKMYIVGKAKINNNTTYIIWGGSGGSTDNDSNLHYVFVTIDPNNKAKVSSIAQEASDDQILLNSGFINIRYHNDKPYSDANDFGSYTYDPVSNKIINTKLIKNDKYYQNKFSNYTSQKIITLMKKENCYSAPQDNKFEFSHACNFGGGYCFMFHAMQNPVRNKSYNLLANTCKNM